MMKRTPALLFSFGWTSIAVFLSRTLLQLNDVDSPFSKCGLYWRWSSPHTGGWGFRVSVNEGCGTCTSSSRTLAIAPRVIALCDDDLQALVVLSSSRSSGAWRDDAPYLRPEPVDLRALHQKLPLPISKKEQDEWVIIMIYIPVAGAREQRLRNNLDKFSPRLGRPNSYDRVM